MNLVLVGKKGLDKCLLDAICPFIRGKSDDGEACLPFCQGDKNSSSPTTDHRIHLPITNPRTFFNDAGVMIYRDPVFNRAPSVSAAITFFSFLSAT
ncbi:MAG: hypothetical protein CDV28_10255 [Candidatus Electronema aureum]|uniref:Uncharacterized protein n=1 Tax=Candidatus Electronema aureum TaxID=2005002 RepID=A0A521G4L1_9BACT|nr:MAG: hypothetical protein CDV28_10255 [Candidatus Electronema aureum]